MTMTWMLSSSEERPSASSVIAARRRLVASRRLVRRRALRPRPFRPAGRRRRIGGRIAGGKGLLELLVELLLYLGGGLARRRLARFFHPGCSGGTSRKEARYAGPSRLGGGLDPYRSAERRKRGLARASWDRTAIHDLAECAILRATQAFQSLKLIFLQLETDRFGRNDVAGCSAASTAGAEGSQRSTPV
jgi:hypothetical protein